MAIEMVYKTQIQKGMWLSSSGACPKVYHVPSHRQESGYRDGGRRMWNLRSSCLHKEFEDSLRYMPFYLKTQNNNLVSGCTLLILVLERQRQEDFYEFKASMNYITSSRTAKAT